MLFPLQGEQERLLVRVPALLQQELPGPERELQEVALKLGVLQQQLNLPAAARLA